LKRGDLVTVVAPGDYGKPRPALVIQADRVDNTVSVTVLLLSSTLQDAPVVRYTVEPSPANGLRVTSQVQIDKALSISRSKIGPEIGRLDDDAMVDITRLVAVFFGVV
jgi:mRNA interferase MazF